MLVKVTQLEAFRRFIQDVSMYDTEQSLIESWSGVFQGNEYTRIGQAFHSIVEKGDISIHSVDKCIIDPVIFHEKQIDIALAYREEISGCFHEIRHNKKYTINNEEIEVTGCADVIHGLIIRDIKTKFSDLRDISDYTDSIQWKLYCDIFDIPLFSFDVFQFKGYDKERNGYDVSNLELVKHDPIECLSYPNMQADILIILDRFLEFVKFRNLENLFVKQPVHN